MALLVEVGAMKKAVVILIEEVDVLREVDIVYEVDAV